MSFPQSCSCVSSTLIVCQSPAANQSQQATARFYLNEVLYRGEDESPSGRGPDEDEEPHADAFHFDYVEDPQFYTANKEKLIKHHPGEPLILIINVSVCWSFSHRRYFKGRIQTKVRICTLSVHCSFGEIPSVSQQWMLCGEWVPSE